MKALFVLLMLKVGFFSAGLDTYWGQFDGLLDNLNSYSDMIVSHIVEEEGVEVCNIGMVDSPAKAKEGAARLKNAGVDIVFAHIACHP